MLSTTTRPSPAMTGALAVVIAVVLGAGVIGAATKSGDDESARDDPAPEAVPQQPDPAVQSAAEADRRAFDLILANREACNNRYLPDARARHAQAVAQLREQEEALRRVINELPPGRTKDSLIAQVGPDFESAISILDAELRGVESRCKLALTVYQLTHDSLPRPVPGS